MSLETRGRWRLVRLVGATLALVVVVTMSWLGVGGPAPGEGAAGVITSDAIFFMRIPTMATAMEWTAATRGDVPALDRRLSEAREALGYDLLDPDTWRGLGVNLDGPFSVALVPAPPLSAVLVLSVPIHEGAPALLGGELLFARVPIKDRPRLEHGEASGALLVRLWLDGSLDAVLMQWKDHVFVALPIGSGDREAGLNSWVARTTDMDGVRLVTQDGIREALRGHKDEPLLILRREDGDALPSVRTPDDPVIALGEIFEHLLGN